VAILSSCTVADRVLDPDNIIHDYEWFHQAHESIEARQGQIAQHASFLAEETDASEKTRLRIELSGMQQSCRLLVAEYNANANQVTTSIFKGATLPEQINLNVCE
tara:strand:+ start:583 stop:897 length:315 start_codon:yes stop_codon:yes gene_type:complete